MTNDRPPEFGLWTYQYIDVGSGDCAIHHIRVSPSKDVVYVLTADTSHEKDGTVAGFGKEGKMTLTTGHNKGVNRSARSEFRMLFLVLRRAPGYPSRWASRGSHVATDL
jgi:hypothetical protein